MTGAHDGALQLCRSRIEELDLPATTPTHSMHIDYPETGASISAIGALRRGANLRELETYTLIWFEGIADAFAGYVDHGGNQGAVAG